MFNNENVVSEIALTFFFPPQFIDWIFFSCVSLQKKHMKEIMFYQTAVWNAGALSCLDVCETSFTCRHCGHSSCYHLNNSPSLNTFHLFSLLLCPHLREQAFFFVLYRPLRGLHHSNLLSTQFLSANSPHLFTATLSQIHMTLLR